MGSPLNDKHTETSLVSASVKPSSSTRYVLGFNGGAYKGGYGTWKCVSSSYFEPFLSLQRNITSSSKTGNIRFKSEQEMNVNVHRTTLISFYKFERGGPDLRDSFENLEDVTTLHNNYNNGDEGRSEWRRLVGRRWVSLLKRSWKEVTTRCHQPRATATTKSCEHPPPLPLSLPSTLTPNRFYPVDWGGRRRYRKRGEVGCWRGRWLGGQQCVAVDGGQL